MGWDGILVVERRLLSNSSCLSITRRELKGLSPNPGVIHQMTERTKRECLFDGPYLLLKPDLRELIHVHTILV